MEGARICFILPIPNQIARAMFNAFAPFHGSSLAILSELKYRSARLVYSSRPSSKYSKYDQSIAKFLSIKVSCRNQKMSYRLSKLSTFIGQK